MPGGIFVLRRWRRILAVWVILILGSMSPWYEVKSGGDSGCSGSAPDDVVEAGSGSSQLWPVTLGGTAVPAAELLVLV